MTKAFNDNNRKMVSVYKSSAKFVSGTKSNIYSYTYDLSETIAIHNYIVDIAYFPDGNMICRQAIGIRIVSPTATYQADLGLRRNQFEFIERLYREENQLHYYLIIYNDIWIT